MKTKIKLTKLNKDELNKKQMNLINGGANNNGAVSAPIGSGCAGCLCNADISGQCATNSSNASSSAS